MYLCDNSKRYQLSYDDGTSRLCENDANEINTHRINQSVAVCEARAAVYVRVAQHSTARAFLCLLFTMSL